MSYDYDVLVIGLGPAGMAVSIMASEMGLKVCAVEKHSVGGECMNVGCIPSKALLRIAKTRHAVARLGEYEMESLPLPATKKPFDMIQKHLQYISEKKTMGMFKKVEMVYRQGAAKFVDPHTVEVAGKRYSARRVFLCVGTKPQVPQIPGIDKVDYLTNENVFSLPKVPRSMIVLGGGAIACEMAQAFQRLGSQVTMVIRGPRLMWREDPDATDVVEASLLADGVKILRDQKPASLDALGDGVLLSTSAGEKVEAEQILLALGRSYDFSSLDLAAAGVRAGEHGEIAVDKTLRTSQKHIYACGDCNGHAQFSHAAMHQGMIALMNSMSPWPFKQDFRKFVVPWTVFTEPQFSRVGEGEKELGERGVKFETITVKYGDYGAAIAEHVDAGFIRALVSPMGRIYGVTIVGEGSGEMINEWALAIQKKIRLHDVMLLQHSFPTMGFLSKRVSETWMMNKMGSAFLKRLCALFYRMGF